VTDKREIDPTFRCAATMPTLAIVSPSPADRPVFEATFPQALSGKHNVIEQLVLNSSLDMLDEAMWMTKDMYVRAIDRYNDQLVSAYVTPSNYRFLLLHDGRHEDGVKAFFSDLHELFTKATLNPLYEPGEPITSLGFSDRVVQLARKHL
jgi:trafficking protein particle complex subunit 2